MRARMPARFWGGRRLHCVVQWFFPEWAGGFARTGVLVRGVLLGVWLAWGAPVGLGVGVPLIQRMSARPRLQIQQYLGPQGLAGHL